MKTLQFLAALFLSQLVFGQQIFPISETPTQTGIIHKGKNINNKVAGDTLWSEDFNGGLPSGWTIVNNNANNFDWQWDTVYRPGQFTGSNIKINSTTNSNGFMLLPMDFFSTPIPGSGAISSDTYFQSAAIPITPKASVELRLQQFSRFCCSNSNRVVVQVSTDNFQNFDEYNLRNQSVNASSPNAEFVSLNLSQTLANEDTAYLRFYVEGASHYFWMIDDLALVEGNGQEITSVKNYAVGRNQVPFPTIFPFFYINQIGFEAEVSNISASALTNVNLSTDITHVKYPNGSTGNGLVFSQNTAVGSSGALLPFQNATVQVQSPSFSPSSLGDFKIQFNANSSQYPITDSASLFLTVGDKVFGRDYSNKSRVTGPSYYVGNMGLTGGTANGDRMGISYRLDSIPYNLKLSSISIYISNDSNNIGSVIRPVVWEYDSSQNTNLNNIQLNREVASSLSNYTITSNMLDSWQSFSLDTGIAINRNTNYGTFVVGWEQVGGAPNSYFTTWSDDAASLIAPAITAFISFGHSNPTKSWNWISILPMVRLNIEAINVGLNKVASLTSLTIFPNPSNGIFKIQTNEKIQAIEIFDINGKLIGNDFNSTQSKVDLSNEKAGIYFIRLQTVNGEWISKKVMKN